MAQAQIWVLEEHVNGLQTFMDVQNQQLADLEDALDRLERGGADSLGHFNVQIGALQYDVRLLIRQVRNFMRWEPWLLRVYRWWYGAVTPE